MQTHIHTIRALKQGKKDLLNIRQSGFCFA